MRMVMLIWMWMHVDAYVDVNVSEDGCECGR